MANSDNTFGVFNKQTVIYKEQNYTAAQNGDKEWTTKNQSWSNNVETAKSYMLTDDALNCINTNGTQIQWAIVESGNALKMTIAFGAKADPSADEWAALYKTQSDSLNSAGNWYKPANDGSRGTGHNVHAETSDDHLF